MQPSIWTSFYFELSPEDAVRRFADHGWRFVELSSEHLVALDDSPNRNARIEGMRSVLDEVGVSAAQAHGFLQSNFSNSDEGARRVDIDRAKRWLPMCAALGVKAMVLHPGGECWQTAEERSRLFERIVSAYRELAPAAERVRVNIAPENTIEPRQENTHRIAVKIEDLHEIIDRVGSGALGICLDTSHANASRLDVAEAVRACGSRLVATHISDNDGSGDQHKMPYNAKINWRPVVAALKEINYRALFNLEIPGERPYPLEVLDLKSSYALQLVGLMLS